MVHPSTVAVPAALANARTASGSHLLRAVFHSGLDDFKKAAAQSSTPVKFHYLAHGDRYKFAATR
jgi:hypothetical protein